MSDYPLTPYKKLVGQPGVVNAIALDWTRDFDAERVAAKFGTRPPVVRRILARDEVQAYIQSRLLPMESTVEAVRHRLFEELTKEALSPRPSKERSEARAMLVRNLIPEMKKVVTEVRHVIEAPRKMESTEEWSQRFRTPPPILEAEVIDDAEHEQQGSGGQAPALPPASEAPGS